MKKLFFLLFALIVLGFTWGYSTLWFQQRTLEADYLGALDEMQQLEEALQQETESLEAARSELRTSGNRINELEEELEGARLKYMPLFSTESDARSRFVQVDTELMFLPGREEAVLRDVSAGTIVQVIQKTTNLETGEEWLYVQVPVYDTPQDNRGYILLDTAVYFTPDLERQAVSPLTLPEGTNLYSVEPGRSEEVVDVTERVLRVFLIGPENGLVRVGASGGQEYLVNPEAIGYPQSPLR